MRLFSTFPHKLVEILLSMRSRLRTVPSADMLVDLVPVLSKKLKSFEKFGMLFVGPSALIFAIILSASQAAGVLLVITAATI